MAPNTLPPPGARSAVTAASRRKPMGAADFTLLTNIAAVTIVARNDRAPTPAGLESFFGKVNEALRSWRDDESETRYMRIWAMLAATLEQAMQVPKAQRAIEMPADRRGAAT